MNLSPAQKRIKEKEKARARKLYEQGYTTRQIGLIVGKSRSWVSVVTRGLWWKEENGKRILVKLVKENKSKRPR